MRIKQARHDDMGSSVDRTVERMFVLTCIKAATWHLSTWHGHELLKDHGPLIMAEISISIAYAHHGTWSCATGRGSVPARQFGPNGSTDRQGACVPVRLEHLMLAFAAFMNAQHAVHAEQYCCSMTA